MIDFAARGSPPIIRPETLTSNSVFLVDHPADDFERRIIEGMLERHPKVLKAIKGAAKGQSSEVGPRDLEELRTLRATVKGFASSPFPGRLYRGDGFLHVVLHGKIGRNPYNIYIVKVGDGPWAILETKKMM